MEQVLEAQTRERVGQALEQVAALMVRHLSDRKRLGYGAGATLTRVARDGATRLTALAASEGISQPSMSQLVQRLERQGLLTRVSDDEDRRATLVDITDAGRELLGELRAEYRERLADLLATLPPEDEATLALAMHVALPIVQRLIETATAPRTEV